MIKSLLSSSLLTLLFALKIDDEFKVAVVVVVDADDDVVDSECNK